jgi:ribosome maturation factor RimP
MSEGSFVEKFRSIAAEVVGAREYELVHTEVSGSKRNPVMTAYVDKAGGINIDECSEVSREIEAQLDADDLVPATYILEVSSPGIERGLYSLADFERFIGSEARVKTIEAIDERKSFTGTIKGVEADVVHLEDTVLGLIKVPFENIKKSNLKVDFNKELRR